MVTAVNKTTEETVSPPGTTALAEPSTSQSESIIFPPLISENLTNNTNPVNLHVPDTDSTSTSCQLSESRPDVVAPETVIIIKKRDPHLLARSRILKRKKTHLHSNYIFIQTSADSCQRN